MAIAHNYPKPKELGNLMLDLETMGNAQNSAIVSIGAVEFILILVKQEESSMNLLTFNHALIKDL